MEYTAYFGLICEWMDTGSGIYKNGFIKTSKEVIEVFPDESKLEHIERIIANSSNSNMALNKNNMVELVSVYDHVMYNVTRIYKKKVSIQDDNIYYCTNQETTNDLLMVCIGENVLGKNITVYRNPVLCVGKTKFNQLAHSIVGRPFYRNKTDTPGLHRIPATYNNYPLYVVEPRQAIYKDPALDTVHSNVNTIQDNNSYTTSDLVDISRDNPFATPEELASELIELDFVMNNIEIAVGDKRDLKLRTNVTNYEILVQDKEVIRYNPKTREIEGLKEGNTSIIARYSLKGKVIKEAYLRIAVILSSGLKSNAIMLHNRNTNRLVTMQLGRSETEDITYTLPNGGELITAETYSFSDKALLERPTVLSPANGATDVEGVIRISKFETERTTEPLVGTVWQFSITSSFRDEDIFATKEKMNLRYNDPYIMATTFSLLTFYVRAKYVTKNYESLWSVPLKITTKNTGTDGLDTVLYGDSWNGGYMGTISYDQCIDKIDYLGNYQVRYNIGARDVKKGEQVFHNGEVYMALQDMNSSTITTPINDKIKWQIEDRHNKLPTYKVVNERIGLGLGLTDNNVDGLSTTHTKLGIASTDADKMNWFKFIYRGRIYYVPQIPFTKVGSEGVCWNDIAKREAVYGDRTIVICGNMYRVGLPNIDMWSNTMDNMYQNGRKTNWFDYDPIKDLQLHTGGWFEDFREGPVRAAYIAQGADKINVVVDIDCKRRGLGWRPVLELIAKGNEPYNNLPPDDIPISVPPTNEPDGVELMDVGTNEKFIYDPHTDTGWFGMTHPPYTISIRDFWIRNGMSIGGSRNGHYDYGYFKFYWHGKVLYIEARPEFHTVTPLPFKDNNFMHGIDMGGTEKKIVDFNGMRYTLAPICICNSEPYDKDYGEQWYSQFTELIMRACRWAGHNYYRFWNYHFQRGINFNHPKDPVYDMQHWWKQSGGNGWEIMAREIRANNTSRDKYALLDVNTWDIVGKVITFHGAQNDDAPIFVLWDLRYQKQYNF